MSDSPYDCSKNPMRKKKSFRLSDRAMRDWREGVIKDQRERIKSLLNHIQLLSIVIGLLITSILIASQFI